MHISKKQSKSSNPTRYSSKKYQNQSSFIFTHRPQQSSYQSHRSSNQKILKLRGNSKTNGIKVASQQKFTSHDKILIHDKIPLQEKTSSINNKSTLLNDNKYNSTNQKSTKHNDSSIKHERKFSNAQITQSKKYLLNSTDSAASFNYKKQNDSMKKPNYSSLINNSMNLKISGSFSKNRQEYKSQHKEEYKTNHKDNYKQEQSKNKQNNILLEQQKIQRKKSNQKGLIITKKSSNQNSYFAQGYQTLQKNNKPKSARVEKPLAQNYLFLNLNEIPVVTTKPKQFQHKKKLSIDFDAFCKMNKLQEERKKIDEQKKKANLQNFYSQRNSVCNYYPTGVPSRQVSKDKITFNINQRYESIKLQKKNDQQQKRLQINEMYDSIMLKSKYKLNDKMSKQSKKGSFLNISYLDKGQMTNRQPQKSQRINNYMQDSSSLIQSNHKRILSILQKSSSKFFDQFQKQKIQTSRNYQPNKNYSTNKNYQHNQDIKNNQDINKINHQKQRKTINQIIKYSPNSFSYDYVVGKGGFGKVWKVHCKRTNTVFALKEMSKALIISKKSVPSVMNEQQLLKDLKNTFLVNMVQSFQTRQNLYLLMDYLSGGDLRHHLAVKKYFTQDQTKFIIICILLGLKYLHQNQIIHRDIKPQNIVLDDKGYARITDLGVARKWRQNNSVDTSGTPGYMAPEVLCRQNHSYEADYFAVGVITYEMMLRRRPYYGKSRKQIRDEVLAKQVQIKRQQIPEGWPIQGADFINRMIQRKPSNRLGFNGIQQIFNHPWLRNIPLYKIEERRIQSPYVPNKISKGQSDYLNYTSSQDTQIQDLIAQNEIMLRQKQVQNLFEGYQHV